MLPIILFETAALGVQLSIGCAFGRHELSRQHAGCRPLWGPLNMVCRQACLQIVDVVLVQGCHTSLAAPEHRQRPAEIFS